MDVSIEPMIYEYTILGNSYPHIRYPHIPTAQRIPSVLGKTRSRSYCKASFFSKLPHLPKSYHQFRHRSAQNEVYGDDDDQYWNRRLPFRLSLDISILAFATQFAHCIQQDSKMQDDTTVVQHGAAIYDSQQNT